MKTITLQIDDSVNDKFMWLVNQFASSGIRIIDSHAMESTPNNRYNFQDLIGRLQWTGDAVSEQKRLRDEW